MRGGNNLRLTDVHKLQKNIKQKSEKEADALIQLMELPDFDTSEFIQTLLKSDRHQQVLKRIPVQKKIDFFAKNYLAFLQSQDELLSLTQPKLQQIPKAKHFKFQQQKQEKQVENIEQSSVLQIIDTFSSYVLQKNIDQTLRIYKIIQDMKKVSKYKIYFNNYLTNKIFLQTYNSFIDNCNNYQVLIRINEYEKAIQVYLTEKSEEILSSIKINLNINDSPQSMGKEMTKLVNFIDTENQNFRIKFKKEIDKNVEINSILSNWINKLTKNYYALIETYVYENDQLSDILQTLNIVLEASTQLQSKGITLERQIKELIAIDLPLHISKVIEIIVDSVNEILKENNDLYEFVYFSSIKNFSKELADLKLVPTQEFGKKCATCKGIILVNSFILILQTICDEKWTFLYECVIDILIKKIALNILNFTLHYWDYYFIYQFFERLAGGKVKYKELFSGELNGGLAEKLGKIKSLSEQSWGLFENKLYAQFFKQILTIIPRELFNFTKYGYYLEKQDLRPSTLSLSIIFKMEQFIRQIQFRMTSSQFEYIALVFFEFIIFTIEYVVLSDFHNKGTNDKVFILHSKQQKLLKKVKQFNFQDIEDIKQHNLLSISKLNKFGFYKLVFEIYFLAEILKIMTDSKKIQAEQFNIRLAKILAKDRKKDVIDMSKKQFEQTLNKMIKVYKQKPQLMQNYLNDRKKE